jgi:heat shock protein HslJ
VRRAAGAGLVVLLSLLAACGSGRSEEADNLIPRDTGTLAGTEWKLVANEELFEITDANPVTLNIEQGTASGRAPCNSYNLSFVQDGDDITTGPVAGTKMACPQDQMDAEAKYFAALDAVDTAALENDRLVLTGPDEVLLVFARVNP